MYLFSKGIVPEVQLVGYAGMHHDSRSCMIVGLSAILACKFPFWLCQMHAAC